MRPTRFGALALFFVLCLAQPAAADPPEDAPGGHGPPQGVPGGPPPGHGPGDGDGSTEDGGNEDPASSDDEARDGDQDGEFAATRSCRVVENTGGEPSPQLYPVLGVFVVDPDNCVRGILSDVDHIMSEDTFLPG